MGAPTLDVWVVRKDFAKAHPEVVTAFARSALAAQAAYLNNPEQWLQNQAHLAPLSLEWCAHRASSSAGKGNTYLPVAEQITQLGQPVDQAIRDTAEFLKQQGKILKLPVTTVILSLTVL